MADPKDLVTCLECWHQAKSLARHLAKHGLNAESYRAKHGEDALIISPSSEKKRSQAIKASRASDKYTGKKQVTCPSCRAMHEVSKFSGPHELCTVCKRHVGDAYWAGKTEPEDYVTCVECGHRAVNITSHITSQHPGYRESHPNAPITARTSPTRDKSKLMGAPLSDETRALMSRNAGRWNLGLTKEDHPSLARQSEKMRGKPSWSKGLTKEDHPSLASTSAKLKLYIGENRPWKSPFKVELTLEDIQPILDDEGRLDRQKALALGIPWQACKRYLSIYGGEISDVNVKARLEASGERFREETIRIEKEALLPFALKNGKIALGRAAFALSYSTGVVSREIKRNGLTVARGRVKQAACLAAVSQALRGKPWEDEWKSHRFKNPNTGWRFRYDGYFPDASLVVEFHGHHHFVFPNAFHKTEAQYLTARARDKLKRELVQGAEDFSYLEVRYDEPFDDVMYLRGRINQLFSTRVTARHRVPVSYL